MDIMRDSLAARIDEDMPGGTVRSLAANCFRDLFYALAYTMRRE